MSSFCPSNLSYASPAYGPSDFGARNEHTAGELYMLSGAYKGVSER